MVGRETHRSIRDGLLVPKMTILVGKYTVFSHPMSLKVSKKSWLMEARDDACFPAQIWYVCNSANPEDVVPKSCMQVIYGCTQFLKAVQVVICRYV